MELNGPVGDPHCWRVSEPPGLGELSFMEPGHSGSPALSMWPVAPRRTERIVLELQRYVKLNAHLLLLASS